MRAGLHVTQPLCCFGDEIKASNLMFSGNFVPLRLLVQFSPHDGSEVAAAFPSVVFLSLLFSMKLLLSPFKKIKLLCGYM